MKLATGTVVEGKVVIDGDALPEGTVVTVLAPEVDEIFDVPPELEHELNESLEQAARGETIPVAEAIRQMRAI